jgi:hypothetical protein
MNSSTNNHTSFSPYLLSRFHQHLNHLNDMAFTHTKILQEIIEKRSNEPITSSPHGSISSSPSSSSSTIDSIRQRKRSYPCNDNHDIKNENHLNKRPRKQSKPQQLLQIDKQKSSSEDEGEEEEEMGEIIEPIEKQVFHQFIFLSFEYLLFCRLRRFHFFHFHRPIYHFLIIFKN